MSYIAQMEQIAANILDRAMKPVRLIALFN
jgi:hypothetical protein